MAEGTPGDIQSATSTEVLQMCPHNSTFFAAPNANAVVELQRQQLLQGLQAGTDPLQTPAAPDATPDATQAPVTP